MKRILYYAVIILFLIIAGSCHKAPAGFALLIARIEQNPDTVTPKILNTVIKQAKTTSDKLTLLRLSKLLSEKGVLNEDASCTIAFSFLKQHQTVEVLYCSVSILINADRAEAVIKFLPPDYLDIFPELYAELIEKCTMYVFHERWLSANQFDFLANVLNEPKYHVYASIAALIDYKFEDARQYCRKALQAGYKVPITILWYTKLYEDIVTQSTLYLDEHELRYVLDAAFILKKLDILQNLSRTIEATDPRKFILAMGYCNYMQYLQEKSTNANKQLPWTVDNHMEEQLFTNINTMLQPYAIEYNDFYICASYVSLLFYSGHYDMYNDYIKKIPNEASFQGLRLYHTFQFESRQKATAEAIMMSTRYYNNNDIQRLVLYSLVINRQWSDFAQIYRKAYERKIAIDDSFLQMIYALLVIPNIERHFEISSNTNGNFFYVLNKAKINELIGMESEAMNILESLLAQAVSNSEKAVVLNCLIELSKKMNNERKRMQYALLLRDIESDSIVAITETTNAN